MKKFISLLFIFSLVLFINSCKDPEPEPKPEPKPESTENDFIIEWIWNVMTDVYLWAGEVDQTLFPTDEKDPEVFFYSILNENDRFSWIVDDYDALINSFNNISLSTGISPSFIRVSGTDEVIIVVEYVSSGSPADIAGIQRGEIITDINGTTVTINNYIDLFYSENVVLEFADYINGNLVMNEKEVELTALVIEENPVLHNEIIDYEGFDIGYIVYTGFSSGEDNKWVDSLDNVFEDFKTKGISELIIDLRYNSGGRVSVATHIASVVSPANIPGNNNIFVKYQWNETYQQYFKQTGGEDSENLVVFFEDDPSVNLDLTNIYFLTSSRSASASELIIIGLDPYMDVTQIGENTYGKFYGSITVPDTEEPARHNWAVQPLVFKFTNYLGFSDFNDGLEPDFPVDDNVLDMKQFGDITDPLLAKALEEITSSTTPIGKKSALPPSNYSVLPDPVRELKNRAIMVPDAPIRLQ